MTKVEKDSIEKYTFSISIQMATICVLFILAVGWQGSNWANQILLRQSINSGTINAKLDLLIAREKGQSDSIRTAYNTSAENQRAVDGLVAANQINIDEHRRIWKLLRDIESTE